MTARLAVRLIFDNGYIKYDISDSRGLDIRLDSDNRYHNSLHGVDHGLAAGFARAASRSLLGSDP
jgi:hypothetical protein